MPDPLIELSRSLAYVTRNRLPYTRERQLLEQLHENVSAPLGPLLAQQKLPPTGRSNFGLKILRFEHADVLRKTTAVLREYLTTRALCGNPSPNYHAAILAVGAKGPIFRILQEYLPQGGEDLDAAAHADLVIGFSRDLSTRIPQSIDLPRAAYHQIRAPRFLKRVAHIAGDPPTRIKAALEAIERNPWTLQHGDLHHGNIRRRQCGQPVAIDFGTVNWNIEGADFFWLAPDGCSTKEIRDKFETATDIAADKLGKSGLLLRQAALLQAAARHQRRAIRHRDRDRSFLAARIAAEALSNT